MLILNYRKMKNIKDEMGLEWIKNLQKKSIIDQIMEMIMI